MKYLKLYEDISQIDKKNEIFNKVNSQLETLLKSYKILSSNINKIISKHMEHGKYIGEISLYDGGEDDLILEFDDLEAEGTEGHVEVILYWGDDQMLLLKEDIYIKFDVQLDMPIINNPSEVESEVEEIKGFFDKQKNIITELNKNFLIKNMWVNSARYETGYFHFSVFYPTKDIFDMSSNVIKKINL
tara:strand:- start:7418 stop:7981 length:564 start_codon:yes stop_codon:yes gene_type:complete